MCSMNVLGSSMSTTRAKDRPTSPARVIPSIHLAHDASAVQHATGDGRQLEEVRGPARPAPDGEILWVSDAVHDLNAARI